MARGGEEAKRIVVTVIILTIAVYLMYHPSQSSQRRRNTQKAILTNKMYQCERFCNIWMPCKQYFQQRKADYELCMEADQKCFCRDYTYWTLDSEKYIKLLVLSLSLIATWGDYFVWRWRTSKARRRAEMRRQQRQQSQQSGDAYCTNTLLLATPTPPTPTPRPHRNCSFNFNTVTVNNVNVDVNEVCNNRSSFLPVPVPSFNDNTSTENVDCPPEYQPPPSYNDAVNANIFRLQNQS